MFLACARIILDVKHKVTQVARRAIPLRAEVAADLNARMR